ncbi:MAG: creatininase family protein [bacterium]
MRWEELSSTEFAHAVRETGVCVVAMGVLEKHSEHLPLGTDVLISHRAAVLASKLEPAIVFPPFYFGQIYEARCFPGTLTIKPSLLMELIEGVLDEIGRNGFKKIIIHNGHGGNCFLVKYLAQCSLWQEKPYSLYVQGEWLNAERKARWNSLLETKVHGHACECETSCLLAVSPELVKMDRVPATPAFNQGRTKHLTDSFSGIGWYSSFPDHYAGDARAASVVKGNALMGMIAESLAEFIKAVKADRVVPSLEREFFQRERDIRRNAEIPM